MIPIKDYKHLYRDENSGAVINTDTVGYQQYKKTKKIKFNQKNEIEKMKDDIEEIKNVLKQIVDK